MRLISRSGPARRPGLCQLPPARFQPRGRPDGGNGGSGGDVILEVFLFPPTLSHFKRRRVLQAENGRRGMGKDRHGKNGATVIVPVPSGTRVFDADSGRLLADLMTPDNAWSWPRAAGAAWATPTSPPPECAPPASANPAKPGRGTPHSPGTPDPGGRGPDGAPNAGKTTLLKALTASKARSAPFPSPP